MKKIVFCMMAVLILAACNNKTENTNDNANNGTNAPVESEMPVANTDDEGQTEWTKQTTIMSSKPMVIDFFATWCGPYKQLAPVLDEIEKNHKGEVIFKRVDIDKEPDLAQEFKVEAVPTLMFVTPKGEYQTLLGYQDAPVIEAKIDELLNRSAK